MTVVYQFTLVQDALKREQAYNALSARQLLTRLLVREVAAKIVAN